jgi:IclR family pca regulon transcriptional regulator
MNSVKSAARVLDVLELFSVVDGSLGVSDVARRLSIPKSSAQGLLTTLASRRYLERAGSAYLLPDALRSGRWIGGPRAHLVRTAHPLMDQMAVESGESAFLGVMTEGLEVQYVAKAISSNEVRYDASLEHLRPGYSTSIGLVILSHMGEDAVEDYLARVRLRRLTERTTTDRAVIRDLILRARRMGYMEMRDTNIAGVSGVSAPVFGHDGQIVAGLNLGAPTWRFNKVRSNLIRIVTQRADELSTRLGMARHPA